MRELSAQELAKEIKIVAQITEKLVMARSRSVSRMACRTRTALLNLRLHTTRTSCYLAFIKTAICNKPIAC